MTNQNKQLSFFDQEEQIENPQQCESAGQVTVKMHIDGASRNNPGKAGAGFSLFRGDFKLCEQGFFVGHRTNNQAEYFALLLGLYFAKEYLEKQENLLVFSDSQLLVRQMTGVYKIRDPLLKKMKVVAEQFMKNYKVTFCHVYREQNQRADFLANRGIDKIVLMPKKFADLLKDHDIE
ncbi:ribonuclease HI family protein [Candidatus Babeliales bacterium]|nr:ribonuclease HI family protein [Candidatus Babeliales bacterium]